MSSNCNEPKDGAFTLESFEKNAYFHGKLMTAHDMELEQRTLDRKLYTVNRMALGYGYLYGLYPDSIKIVEEGVSVSIPAGIAIDRAGRLLLLNQKKEKKATGDLTGNTAYVYLSYQECHKDPTFVIGDEGCKENCCHGHILESFGLTVKKDAPVSPFTDKARNAIKDIASWESKGASWAETEYSKNKDGYDDISVSEIFLCAISKTPAGWDINKAETDKYRPIVRDNRMLYDIIYAHQLAKNPHKATATDVGALKSVNGLSGSGGNVTIVGASPITVSANAAGHVSIGYSGTTDAIKQINTVPGQNGQIGLAGDSTITVTDDAQNKKIIVSVSSQFKNKVAGLENRVEKLERYIIGKAFEKAENGLSAGRAKFPGVTLNVVGKLDKMKKMVRNENVLPGDLVTRSSFKTDTDLDKTALYSHVSPRTLSKYSEALDKVGEALETGDALQMVEALEALGEAAAGLEKR